MLRALGQFPTPVELAELMERMDANRNGVVSPTTLRPPCAGALPAAWQAPHAPAPETRLCHVQRGCRATKESSMAGS